MPPPPHALPRGQEEPRPEAQVAPSVAELRMLLLDCLTLWDIDGRVAADAEGGVTIEAPAGAFRLQPAAADLRPVRWLLHRPDRAPRAAPSIGAALLALRHALGAAGGNRLRIGASAP